MRKAVTVLAAVTAIASGVAVLQLKATIQSKKDDVRALARQIHDDREAIRILEAEWAYQSAPHVLQENSIRFLALMPPKAKQILSSPSIIPFRPKGVDVDADPGVLLPTSHEGNEKVRAKVPVNKGGKIAGKDTRKGQSL